MKQFTIGICFLLICGFSIVAQCGNLRLVVRDLNAEFRALDGRSSPFRFEDSEIKKRLDQVSQELSGRDTVSDRQAYLLAQLYSESTLVRPSYGDWKFYGMSGQRVNIRGQNLNYVSKAQDYLFEILRETEILNHVVFQRVVIYNAVGRGRFRETIGKKSAIKVLLEADVVYRQMLSHMKRLVDSYAVKNTIHDDIRGLNRLFKKEAQRILLNEKSSRLTEMPKKYRSNSFICRLGLS